MSIRRISAVIVIFFILAGAWFVLGSAMHIRSSDLNYDIHQEVVALWGEPICQEAPGLSVHIEKPLVNQIILDDVTEDESDVDENPSREVYLNGSQIDVRLALEHRKKGLNWYPTYISDFKSRYTIYNSGDKDRNVVFHFPLPSSNGTYEKFTVLKDGEELVLGPILDHHQRIDLLCSAKKEVEISVSYRTRGVDRWIYAFNQSFSEIKNFEMQIATDFPNYDYTRGSMSAESIEENEGGVVLRWNANNLITSQDIGIEMPVKLNPGPLSSKMTFFAPICLIFFFSLLAAVAVVKEVNIHPMHFLFVGCGFFAFHLLFAYLVDLVDVHVSFFISTCTTLALVTWYLKGALKGRMPSVAVVLGQLFFLVLFSYSFFVEGTTGLIVAIGSVITLAVMMRLTMDVDWQKFFERGERKPRARRVET